LQPIEFKTEDHLTLRGWFFSPKITPAPGIILTHGFTALKEHGLQRFAEYFVNLGFSVLVYDHRNFGESDGLIRFEVDPKYQVEDMRNAISFLQSHPCVIPEKIGLWGVSFSGGLVLTVAFLDPRLSVAVINVPFVRGPTISEALQKKYVVDARGRASGKPPMMTAVVTADPEKSAVMKELCAYAFFTSVPAWKNTVTLHSVENAGNFHPMRHVEKITIPLLFIVSENDTICPTDFALEAYAKIHSPKKCVMIKGNHFAPFGDAFGECTETAGAWFLEYLGLR